MPPFVPQLGGRSTPKGRIATATDVMAFGLFEPVQSVPLVKERVEE